MAKLALKGPFPPNPQLPPPKIKVMGVKDLILIKERSCNKQLSH